MQRSHLITLLILVAVLLGGALVTYMIGTMSRDDARSDARKTLVTTESQVFTDLSGNEFTFETFEGTVRVVNSWASWSPFSVQELRDLNEIAQEFADRNVVVIAINRKEPKEVAQAFLQTVGDTSSIKFAIDVNDTYYASVVGYAMPETIFYDAQGNIAVHKRGVMTKEEMKKTILEILKK